MAFDPSDSALRDVEGRKGEFRERAREIVSKDRECRKFGQSVDTGGAIARALEAAYKLGLAHASNPQAQALNERVTQPQRDAALAWNSIPPRPRAAFERIMMFEWVVMLAPDAEPWSKSPDKWACYWDRGERAVEVERFALAQTFGRATLAPLVRLGLMGEKSIDGRTLLVPTRCAVATWADAVDAGYAHMPE